MNPEIRKNVYILIAVVVVIFISAILAFQIERDWGKVDVNIIRIPDPKSLNVIVGKLYKPVEATATNKMPAVLALHGYQNDKDTTAASDIELSRRGFVVLAIDRYGQGDTLNTGLPSDGTTGGDTAFKYLKGLAYVDAKNIGITGHSAGASATIATATLNPDHKAVNPQCGTSATPAIHNMLLTQARFEEFAGFRENQPRVEPLTTNANRIKNFGLEGKVTEVKWDTTYGDVAAGTARRQALIENVHPGVTHDSKAVREAVNWFQFTLKDGKADKYWIPAEQQVYMWKELFTLIPLLLTALSIIPLTSILLTRPYFAGVAQELPTRNLPSRANWWWLALVNSVLAGTTYVLFTAGDWRTAINKWLPSWMTLSMENGVMIWFIVNAIICAVLFYFWYRGASKKGVTMYDMGVSFDKEKTVIDWGIIKKTVVLAVILFGWMYLLEFIAQSVLQTEFRFLWPFMRQFTPYRFVLFFIYFTPALAFFLLNGGILFWGQARQKEWSSPWLTQIMWWLKICVFALFGLAVVWAFQYVPYLFMGQPLGFEWVGLPQYSGMWPLMLFVFIPQFVFTLFIQTWLYRKTGRIYLGALIMAILQVWFMAAGNVVAAQ